ncbi:MAG TPA: SRPBCC family protein [Acidiferrobacterales bacterium]|nr:SRPBCC family protein [Acidiferrobacterales bacterium]
MQSLKRILIASVAFLLLLLAIGFLLPGTWHAERAVVIRAPASTIFPYLNNLRQWREWTVWDQQHPQRQTEYSGPDAGVGATSRWRDEEGRGVMKIMQSERNRLVAYTVLFNGGEYRAEGALTLLPEGEATRVVWSAAGETGRKSAIGYFALLQGLRIGADFADSLELLKQKLETKP